MTDTIHGDVRPYLRTIDAATPEQVVKTAHAAAAHIDAQDAKIKALVDLLENPVRSDDGLYDYNQTDVDAALAAAKETT